MLGCNPSLLYGLILYTLLASLFLSGLTWGVWQNQNTWVSDISVCLISGATVSGGLMNDWMSKYFVCIVLIVSGSVMLYSHWYMSGETNHLRFSILVTTFVFSMIVLITSKSMTGVVLGWDGLGLSSYFLVVFYDSPQSSKSGLVTVISNRVGDIFIIIGLFSFIWLGSWDWHYSVSLKETPWLGGIIVLAAVTKSAMFPYCTWLPEAMAAPTPVSSLVHSSTLVTAGVFLIIRFSPMLDEKSWVLLSGLSITTLIVSGTAAVVCMDLKKVVALSTLNQLSFMMITCCLGCPSISLFHLLTHALFKSSLFMSMGVHIHLGGNNQDGRMSGLYPPSWGIYVATVIPVFSLMGVTTLAGFMSKEMILLQSMTSTPMLSLGVTLFVGDCMTIAYSLRFGSSLWSAKQLPQYLGKDSSNMYAISVCLISGATVSGGLMNDWMDMSDQVIMHPGVGTYVKAVAFLVGASCVYSTRQDNTTFMNTFAYLSTLTNWNAPKVSTMGEGIKSNWDKGVLEASGPQWLYKLTMTVGVVLYTLNSKTYSHYMVFSLVALGSLLIV